MVERVRLTVGLSVEATTVAAAESPCNSGAARAVHAPWWTHGEDRRRWTLRGAFALVARSLRPFAHGAPSADRGDSGTDFSSREICRAIHLVKRSDRTRAEPPSPRGRTDVEAARVAQRVRCARDVHARSATNASPSLEPAQRRAAQSVITARFERRHNEISSLRALASRVLENAGYAACGLSARTPPTMLRGRFVAARCANGFGACRM